MILLKKFIYIGFILLLTSCRSQETTSPICQYEDTGVILNIKGIEINTEVACLPEKRAKGLMYREYLKDNAGMIFIFSSPKIQSFWMKNTKLPLSIAYIDSQWQIIDILDLHPYSETSVSSSKPAQFALEVNQGWFDKHNIFVGDYVEFWKSKK